MCVGLLVGSGLPMQFENINYTLISVIWKSEITPFLHLKIVTDFIQYLHKIRIIKWGVPPSIAVIKSEVAPATLIGKFNMSLVISYPGGNICSLG